MKKLIVAASCATLLAVSVMAEEAPKADSAKPVTELKTAPVKLSGATDSTKKAVVEKVAEIKKGGQQVTMKSGLKYTDEVVGTGTEAVAGKTVDVHYTGWLDDAGKKGKKFDSSVDRGQPFSFPLGAGRVIRGWDEGVAGMKVGGKRTLVIPPDLGYGAQGAGGVIPGNSTLIFDVELLKVK